MKKNLFHIRSLFVILALLVTVPLSGQKRKRAPAEVQASATKSREAEFYFTEGEKFFILEDYSKALSYYQKTLEINPDNATVHYKIAEVLSQSNASGDLQKAALSIENALRLEKKNKYFYILAANIFTSQTNFEKAAWVYETLVKEVPGTGEYLFELAAVYQYAGKTDEAIKAYQRAEAALGVNEVSSLQKQKIYLDQGKTQEALAEAEKLLKAFPHDEKIVMGLTELLSQKGLRKEGIRFLEEFIRENDDAGHSKMLLAGLYRDNQEELKAQPLLLSLFEDPAIDVNSKLIIMGAYNAELNHGRTRGEKSPEKEQFVIRLFEKFKQHHPEEAVLHVIGGDLYLSIGKNSQAREEYLKAVKAGDVSFEVWQNLLFLENQLEAYDQVILHSDQALELFPNQGMLYYYNGLAHLKKQQFRDAAAALEQAKRLSATNTNLVAEVNVLLGDAFLGIRDYQKSQSAYEEALRINPEHPGALNNYSYYLAVRKTDLERAEKMSGMLVKNHPDNLAFLDTHAWVLYSRGKFREALRIMERVIATGKATAVQLEHYGDILFRTGAVDAAVAQWEKAKGMNLENESLNKKIANRKIYE